MSNYSSLKATINANIRTNNNQAITGAILNAVLTQILESLGDGYQYKGVALPATNPGSPDQRVFYISGAGTFPNFGSTTIPDGSLGVFRYDSSWHYESVKVVDLSLLAKQDEVLITPMDVRTLATSNGIITANNVWTISSGTCSFLPIEAGKSYRVVNNSGQTANIAVLKQSGVGTTGSTPQWATGYAGRIVMTNGTSVIIDAPSDAAYLYIRRTDASSNDVTPDVFKGIYEFPQYFADLENEIQGIFVNEILVNPIPITNLATSNGIITANNVWTTSSGTCSFLPIEPGKSYKIVNDSGQTANIAVLKVSGVGATNSTPQWATGYTGRIVMANGTSQIIDVPSDGAYLYIRRTDSSSNDVTPQIFGDLDSLCGDVANNSRKLSGIALDYTPGYYFPVTGNTGVPIQKGGYLVTDYIPIKKGCVAIWQHGITASADRAAISVYDSNKTYLTYYSSQTDGQRYFDSFASTLTDDDLYIRISFRIDQIENSFFIANGSVLWSYAGTKIEDLLASLPDFPLNDYLVDGCIASDLWQSYGKGYMLPVTAGEVFYFKAKTFGVKYYYAFLASLPVVNTIPDYSYGVRFDSRDNDWDRIIVPGGTAYLYINKVFETTTDHTPNVKKVAYFPVSPDGLLLGTFNSAYAPDSLDVAIREKYCAKFQDKEMIETFLFFTDPHVTPNSRYETMTELVRDKYISTLQKYYNSLPMDFCICGGDWLNFRHTPAEACSLLGYVDAFMRKLFKGYYPLFGNHDSNPYYPDSSQSSWVNALSFETIVNLMFRENGSPYYSWDGNHTKFYMLNTGVSFIKTMTDATYPQLLGDRWEQVDWLANKLLTDDSEYSVIAMHIYANGSNEDDWFSPSTGYGSMGIHDLGKNVKALAIAYNNRTSITLNGITYDFSSCEGQVLFIQCGHTHWDYVDTTGDIPIVCTTCLEGAYKDGGSTIYALIPTFDCCMLDLEGDAYYMTRVGAGVSRIVNYTPLAVAVEGTENLISKLTGDVTWETRDSSIAEVSSGEVTGVAAGCVGIVATNAAGEEEYWIIKVS